MVAKAQENPYDTDTFKLNEGDENFLYTEIEYDADSKVRIYHDLKSYAMRKNDYNSET